MAGNLGIFIKGDDGISRYMTFRYLFALSVFCIFAIALGAYVAIAENKSSQYTQAVSQLHQKISIIRQLKLGARQLALTTLTPAARDRIKFELRTRLAEIKRIHNLLEFEQQREVLPDNIASIYYSEPVKLNQTLEQFIAANQKLLAMSESDVSAGSQQFYQVLESADAIVAKLDSLALRYAQLQNGQTAQVMRTVKLALVYGPLLLALALIVGIFRPLVIRFVQLHLSLVQADKIKREFMASISHEIRSPMNGIIGTLESLVGGNLSEKQARQAKTALASAESLLDILSDLLGYADIQSNNRETEFYPFNLEALMKNVVQLLTERARRKGLELIMHFEEGTPEFVRGDPSKIRQALFHLISNAIKFTHEGYVIVRVQRKASLQGAEENTAQLQFSVEDTGIGIPESLHESIFDEFFQADGSSTREFSGVGIGLAICKGIITSLGGSIQLRSQVNKGSIFWFEVTMHLDTHVVELVSSLVLLKRVKVLIVEDSDVESSVLLELVNEAGMFATLAAGIGEAITQIQYAALNNSPYQLGIISSALGHGGAIGFRKQLESQQTPLTFPLVALTYGESHTSLKEYTLANFQAVLTRPFKSAVLLETLCAVLQAYRQGRHAELVAIDGNVLSKNLDANASLANNEEALFAGFSILLVEDNRINRALIEDMLHELGATVICAENGLQAVDYVKSSKSVDLVLMDCMMPVMDGYDATIEIRKYLAPTADSFLPIIAVTANALKGDREKCFAAGMDAYLSKPVRKRELIAMIKAWLPSLNQDELKRRILGVRQVQPYIIPQPIEAAKPSSVAEPLNAQEHITSTHPVTTPAAPAHALVSQSTPSPICEPAVAGAAVKSADLQPLVQAQAEQDEAPILDAEVFEQTKAVMKNRFEQMLEYYLEDTRQYLGLIKSALEAGKIEEAVIPVHSIKSSSLQMGFVALSHQAKKMEDFCRDPEQHRGDELVVLAQDFTVLESLFLAGQTLVSGLDSPKQNLG